MIPEIEKGDVVSYHGKLHKVIGACYKGGEKTLKLRSIRDDKRSFTITFNVPVSAVTRVNQKN